MIVHVKPMPDKYRDIPEWLQPCIPPVFQYEDGEDGHGPEDRKLARRLFNLLDAQSRSWYKKHLPDLFKYLSIKSKKCKT